jgi:hypothetical protein
MSHLREIAEKYFRSKQTCYASSRLRGLAAAYGNATDQIETVETAAESPAPSDDLKFDDASKLISINLRARTAGQTLRTCADHTRSLFLK